MQFIKKNRLILSPDKAIEDAEAVLKIVPHHFKVQSPVPPWKSIFYEAGICQSHGSLPQMFVQREAEPAG
jgi:hypothetical protein